VFSGGLICLYLLQCEYNEDIVGNRTHEKQRLLVNPYSHTYLMGPYNWSADLSLFKVFPITESVNLRINVDAFNAFKVQGYTNPNSVTGIQNFLTSYNTPRQLQFTARLSF
jgi:hypothetical protein